MVHALSTGEVVYCLDSLLVAKYSILIACKEQENLFNWLGQICWISSSITYVYSVINAQFAPLCPDGQRKSKVSDQRR